MIRLALLLLAIGCVAPRTAHAAPAAPIHPLHRTTCHLPSVSMKFARVRWSAHAHRAGHSGGMMAPHKAAGQ